MNDEDAIPDARIPIGGRVLPELYRRLKQSATDANMTMSEALEEAVTQWTNKTLKPTASK